MRKGIPNTTFWHILHVDVTIIHSMLWISLNGANRKKTRGSSKIPAVVNGAKLITFRVHLNLAKKKKLASSGVRNTFAADFE